MTGAGNKITTSTIATGTGGNITLTSDDVTVGGNLSGTGTLTLQPNSTAGLQKSMSVRIPVFITSWIQASCRSGRWLESDQCRAHQQHKCHLCWIQCLTDPVTFRSGNIIDLYGTTGPITGTDNASFVFAANVQASSLTPTITTAGQNVTFNGTVDLPSNLVVNAGAGTVAFASTIDNVGNLTVTGNNITFGGAIGGTTALNIVTLTSVNSLTLPAINAARLVATTTGAAGDIILSGNITTTNTITAINLTSAHDILTSGSGTMQGTGGGTFRLMAGNDINFANNYNLSGTLNDIRLRANNSIIESGGGDITTTGGAIILNSDFDAGGAGAISLGAGTALTSNGGNITLGGGADPTIGYAVGTAAVEQGIVLTSAE